MTDAPDKLVEKAARAIAKDAGHGWHPEAYPDFAEDCRKDARAALKAVLPDVRRAVADELLLKAMMGADVFARGQESAIRLARLGDIAREVSERHA